ncbi:hypothetical protein [Lactobacillus corticis]|uniref:Uncharacterized protein n=1 Tax=Lactobacillus corticis TaxID=2201249 RepID=A0A916QH48_9LACO|nr:hypothetical protein [Lactobacillus corticis]GFZ26138.1 hypothetical protein LCB40_00180 [Lactobacillus corticis]
MNQKFVAIYQKSPNNLRLCFTKDGKWTDIEQLDDNQKFIFNSNNVDTVIATIKEHFGINLASKGSHHKKRENLSMVAFSGTQPSTQPRKLYYHKQDTLTYDSLMLKQQLLQSLLGKNQVDQESLISAINTIMSCLDSNLLDRYKHAQDKLDGVVLQDYLHILELEKVDGLSDNQKNQLLELGKAARAARREVKNTVKLLEMLNRCLTPQTLNDLQNTDLLTENPDYGFRSDWMLQKYTDILKHRFDMLPELIK